MNTDTTVELTLANFAKETGFRFRVTKEQAARVAVTQLSEADRTLVSVMDVEAAATFFKATSASGKVLNWVELTIPMAGNWTAEQALTREGAFTEFMTPNADGQTGLDRLRGRRPEVPDTVYAIDGLTVDNYPQRVEAAIGVSVRFRRSSEQTARGLSREEALAENISRVSSNE